MLPWWTSSKRNKNNKSRRGVSFTRRLYNTEVRRILPYDLSHFPLSLGDTELPVTGGEHEIVQNATGMLQNATPRLRWREGPQRKARSERQRTKGKTVTKVSFFEASLRHQTSYALVTQLAAKKKGRKSQVAAIPHHLPRTTYKGKQMLVLKMVPANPVARPGLNKWFL